MAIARDEPLERFVARIVDALHPEAIYLFGSRARGEGRADSDYDFLVIVPDAAPRESWSWRAVGRIPRDPGVSADIVPCRRSVFLRQRGRRGSLSHEVTRRGRLVYGA